MRQGRKITEETANVEQTVEFNGGVSKRNGKMATSTTSRPAATTNPAAISGCCCAGGGDVVRHDGGPVRVVDDPAAPQRLLDKVPRLVPHGVRAEERERLHPGLHVGPDHVPQEAVAGPSPALALDNESRDAWEEGRR